MISRARDVRVGRSTMKLYHQHLHRRHRYCEVAATVTAVMEVTVGGSEKEKKKVKGLIKRNAIFELLSFGFHRLEEVPDIFLGDFRPVLADNLAFNKALETIHQVCRRFCHL